MRPLRSLLFVPGLRRDRLEGAARFGPDGLIVDLEDTVPPADKPQARAHAADFLASAPPLPVFVRPEGVDTPWFEDDLDAVVAPGLAGIFLPKTEGPEHVRAADARLGALERERGLEPGSVPLLLMAETAFGVRNLFESLRASGRVLGTAFGGTEDGDLAGDLGATWSRDGLPLLYARSKVLLDARAAGVETILDAVYAAVADDEGLRADTALGRRLGYTGRLAIHPRQLGTIHAEHTPSPEQVAYYRELLERLREAEAAGEAAIRFRGKLVDYAMARRAERVLALADALG